MYALDTLMRSPKGELMIEAKGSYRDGQAMLTVYGCAVSHTLQRKRVVLHRVFVPRTTPKVEKLAAMRALCDLVAIEYGCEYRLRGKLHVRGR